MGDCCSCNSEITRDGSGQLSRYLRALDPSYAPVDNRSMEDLLVFTKRYANQVRFYDIPESNVGNESDPSKISWREFFRRDMAVIAASISLTDTAEIKKGYDEVRAKLEANPSHSTFDDLFDPILGMIVKIAGWYAIAIPENPLYADLQLAIQSNLKWQAQKIVAYEKGFNYVDAQHQLNLDYSKITDKTLWGLDQTISADISIYQGVDIEDKIRNGALYIDDIFNSFYGFITQLIDNSESYMQFALHHYPAHQPHMALFIAFLQLFRLAQDQMNGITQRMLDFYYRDVLHLTAKPSIPDKVHIVFELPKDVTEYDVAPGTTLKAGKDAGGIEQIYSTENDLVVNQAKVKEIKNIFIEKASASIIQADGTRATQQTIKNIFARPIAKSKDGFGEAFDASNSKWPTFGKGSAVINSKNLCDSVAILDEETRKDQAQVGFAIASPQLVLQGGNRLLLIRFRSRNNKLFEVAKNFETQNPGKSFFNVSLSGEKNWLNAENKLSQSDWDNLLVSYIPKGQTTKETTGIFNPDNKIEKISYFLNDSINSIAVFLPVSEQAVINFDNKIHTGYNYQTTQPVAKVLINSAANINEDDFKSFGISVISLVVKVGSINPSAEVQEEIRDSGQFPSTRNLFSYHFDGLESLILQNETGTLEAGKPFDPFTAYPAKGKSFYIGSEEVFNKPLGRLAVNILKTQQSGFDLSQFGSGVFNVSVLHNKLWDPLSNEQGNNFDQEHLTINILNHAEFADIEGAPTITPVVLPRKPIEHFTEWKLRADKGFLQLEYAEQTESDLQKRQNLAIGLEIKEVSVSYESGLLNLEAGIDQLFHIYPFGTVETYLSPVTSLKPGNTTAQPDFATLNALKDHLLVDTGNLLLPQFNFLSPYSKYYVPQRSVAITTSPAPALHSNLSDAVLNKIDLAKSRSSKAVSLLLNAKDDAGNYNNQYTGDMQEGLLLIGIENLKPLQSISMLFQFAEGSAEDEDNDPPVINWCYLSNNQWRPLKATNIVSDGTYGFQTTGIIKIDTPADATANNTIVTTGLIWFSASVKENANRIPQLIDIFTQAVEAQFTDNNNDPAHFDNALPAASISKLVTAVAQIGKIQQPFASFDGKHAEAGKEFYTRVSERLRHKGRAINAWDYEHLVLDRFPSIYKVKCITHTDPNCLCTNKSLSIVTNVLPKTLLFNGDNVTIAASLNALAELLKQNPLLTITLIGYGANAGDNIKTVVSAYTNGILLNIPITKVDLKRIRTTVGTNSDKENTIDIVETESCCGPQIAPGHVLLIPIANLKNRNAANPLQPKTGRRTLIAIQEYIKKRTSPFVHVYAKNPVYEQIIVQFKVQFYSGIDKGYYIKKLNDEIVHFLTPWAFDADAEVTFNQQIYASSIINFIEERSYVDFITDFTMGVCCNDCCEADEPAGIGVITGTVFDSMEKPLGGITLKIKGLNKTTISSKEDVVKGTYTITNIPPGTYTLSAYFSMFNIAKQVFTVDENGVSTPGMIDFNKGNGNRLDDIETFFSDFCGCTSVEKFLKDDPNFEGDIVAKPCTSRSILVSVPQHIIIPYEEGEEPTPCEKRRTVLGNNATNSEGAVINPDSVAKRNEEKTSDSKKSGGIKPAVRAAAKKIKPTASKPAAKTPKSK